MKPPLAGISALALAGFAFFTTGCVTEYQTVSSVPVYSGTTLPAASRVALVMEFRGGTPTAQEREEVRAILADYLAGKGSVLVDEPSGADYLVHAVLERRNPENPAEWTVVNTYSAHSLAAVGGDDYRWPGGIIEDDYYDTTTFTYVGFGAFYPVWFDAWDSPWYRGRVRLCPPPRPHHFYGDARWREERQWHHPNRWQPERRREWYGNDRDRRDDNRRPDVGNHNRRPEPERHDANRGDVRRRDDIRPSAGADRRDGDRDRHQSDRGGVRPRPDSDRRPPHASERPAAVDRPFAPVPSHPTGDGPRPDTVRPHQPPRPPSMPPRHDPARVNPPRPTAPQTPDIDRPDSRHRGGRDFERPSAPRPQANPPPVARPTPQVQPPQPQPERHQTPSMRWGREQVRERQRQEQQERPRVENPPPPPPRHEDVRRSEARPNSEPRQERTPPPRREEPRASRSDDHRRQPPPKDDADDSDRNRGDPRR